MDSIEKFIEVMIENGIGYLPEPIEKLMEKRLKKDNKINKFNLIKMEGVWFDIRILMKSVDYDVSREFNILSSKISNNNYIKMAGGDTQTRECKNWTDLYKSVGIDRNIRKCTVFKKFLLDTNLVRQYKRIDSKKTIMVVNPTIIRFSSHISEISLISFIEFCAENVHPYSVYFAYKNGAISYDLFCKLYASLHVENIK